MKVPKGLMYKAWKKWGEQAQVQKTMEELAELIVALSHGSFNPSSETLKNIQEEIADAEIMIEQMRHLYDRIGIIDDIKVSKIERLKLLLEDSHE
jgi:NTP pyrophosphatase (non-canonical NTP hydrolase)